MIGTIEKNIVFTDPATLILNENELRTKTSYVRASAFYFDPPDLTTFEIMKAIEASGTLDFWNDPEEDIYDEQDGDAI